MTWQTVSASPQETEALGCRVGSLLRRGDVVFLLGELGAGKTRLAQGIAASMGVGTARSPSFTLIHRYQAAPPIYHADLYRLTSPNEVQALDLAEMAADGILLVEWARLAAVEFPERLEIELIFLPEQEDARLISVRSLGVRYDSLAQELTQLADAGA